MFFARLQRYPRLAFLLIAGAVLTSLPVEEPAAQQLPNIRIVTTLCRTCHAPMFESTARTPHTVLDEAGWQERFDVELSCLGCHGDVAEHFAAGGGRGTVFGFREESPLEQAAVCKNCHLDDHPQFDSSPHARAGLSCTSCHTQHGAPSRTTPLLEAPPARPGIAALDAASGVCFGCHSETFSEFAFNERHRLREGVLSCTSCHDPHAPAARTLLGGFKQQQCIDCHADKGGPFVFEHPASRVEGCTACHSPHGSPNRHLLAHQRVAELCFSCHVAVPQFHFGFAPAGPPRFNLDTQCTNCHSSIHGSNFHPFFLR